MDINPPFLVTYKPLFSRPTKPRDDTKETIFVKGECELPSIDMNRLTLEHLERVKCMKDMADAASSWGIFQVVNHGIPTQVLDSILHEQKKVFHNPFNKKAHGNFLDLSANSYRWGNPKATCLSQLSWLEAFHTPISDIVKLNDHHKSLRSALEEFAEAAAILAQSLAQNLTQSLGGVNPIFFEENCTAATSDIRMNRYPPCPFSSEIYGLMPHTDSDFLTILHQDQIGGLQVLQDGRWLNVTPNPEALIVNIGDLFQAFSNNTYRSIRHRVIAPQQAERFSVSYLYCPSEDALIQSCTMPAVYKEFTFREYRQQIQSDVEATGDKVGLSRFIL